MVNNPSNLGQYHVCNGGSFVAVLQAYNALTIWDLQCVKVIPPLGEWFYSENTPHITQDTHM